MLTLRDWIFLLAGYLSGSILYGPLFGQLLAEQDITLPSSDGNPGTTNAFLYGGFWCGVLTLCGDLAKGFLPVFLYLHHPVPPGLGLSLVLAAPVIGHIFPIFWRFHGGKGIATTFGCLLGLIPDFRPAGILACTFIFFSIILKISPHYYRTILTYLCALGCMARLGVSGSILLGYGLILLAVLVRMISSKEQKGNMKVKLLWKH